MYPNPYHFRGPSSGAWNSGQAPPQPPPPPPPPHLPPPQQPPLQLLNTNFSLPNQNPTNSSYIQPPNPNFPPHHTQNPYPTFPPNNFPIRPLENSTFTPQHLTNLLFWLQILSQNSNSALRPQRLSENPNGNVGPQQPSNSAFRPQSSSENPKEMVERIDSAVEKARGEFVAAGRSVSAWKVLQSALLMLKVDDLNSLGLQMHQVSSLHRLMLTEGRINGFIHCFVLVRRITSLYDLELAICKNEDVEKFEELGLGPLLQHPLVLHYFPVSSDTTEVFKITSEEIMLSLIAFQKQKLKVKDGDAEEFLDFIVKKRSVASKEKLGIRIYGLGMHTSCMREARKLERVTLRKSEKQSKQISAKTSRRRPPIFSSLKKRLDKNFRAISQRAHLFSVVHKDSCGKQDRFISSSGKDLHEDDDRDKDHVTGSQVNFSSQSAKSSGRVSSCTYLSAIEERSLVRSTDLSPANGTQKHNEGNGSTQNKRKYENLINPTSVPPKMHKRDKVEQDVLPTMNGQETEEARNMQKKDLSIANDSLRMFITTWKEACKEQTVAEVLWSMLRSYRRSPKRIISMFSAYPLIGLLNVAISSIKYGMWDTMYDTFQSIGQHGLTNTSTRKYSEYFTTDVEPIIKDVPPVSNEHITERRHNNRLRQRALGQPIRSIRKIIQKSQKKNTLKGSSKGAHPQLKTCFLCRQVGHLRKNCPRLQQAGSSLVPQDSQQLAQYPAQSHPVQPQPQQSTSTAPMPQNSGRGFVTCGPAGRGQVTVTGGESMEVNVNSVIDGSTEKQTKSFILNNEKVLKLSSGESVLSLSSGISLTEVNEQKSLKTKREAINLPPVYLNTAPGFGCSEANLFKTHAPVAQLSSALETKMHDNPEVTVGQIANLAPISVDVNWTIEDDSATSAALVLPDSHNLQEHSGDACNETDTGFHIEFDPINIGFVSHSSELGSSNFSKRDQPRYGTPNGGDAMLTGRLGELVAFKYLIAKAGKPVVRWVNECSETGLPYDIVVGEKENSTEFVEVKATQSPRKDWFRISTREWQFAVDKGEAFSIVHVLLLGNNAARVSVYKNPVKLCHLGKLQLLLTMSKPQKELFLLS